MINVTIFISHFFLAILGNVLV